MKIYSLEFTKKDIEFINSAIDKDPSISRQELSRQLCKQNDWLSSKGKFKEVNCRKALCKLNEIGHITLPVLKREFFQRKYVKSSSEINMPDVNCSLDDLGEVKVYPIAGQTKESEIWNTIISTHHPSQNPSLSGAQIRYLVESSLLGVIGALGFESSVWMQSNRDQFIGWSKDAWQHNIQRIIHNSRLVVLPSVKVPNLDSYMLSLALQRLSNDWMWNYSIAPVLVEAYVNPSNADAKAYNHDWVFLGEYANKETKTLKHAYVYPLIPNWKQELCYEPKRELFSNNPVEEPKNWVEEELGTAHIYDRRIKNRLHQVTFDFFNNPTSDIPEACGGDMAKIKGAYRLFNNPNFDQKAVLDAHLESTLLRCREHSIVLAAMDTTTISYNTHLETKGLGPTGKKGHGMLVHSTLAFTENGIPLGLLDVQNIIRDANETKEQKAQRRQGPIENKESMKWLNSTRKVDEIKKHCPNTTFICIGDRESDIFELFEENQKDPSNKFLLVRSIRGRKRRIEVEFPEKTKVEQPTTEHEEKTSNESQKIDSENSTNDNDPLSEQELLWDYMTTKRVDACFEMKIPRSGSHSERTAKVDVRYAQTLILPPMSKENSHPIKVTAIYLKEVSPDPSVKEPIEWMLLTTYPVDSLEIVEQVTKWYSKRWGIEVYHRILKSGCRVKDRQFKHVDNIINCLAVDMIIAWRIFHLTMLGRETPNIKCTAFFSELEWKILYCKAYNLQTLPDEPISLMEATNLLGKLGGYIIRKNSVPGPEVLWRGLERLAVLVSFVEILDITAEDFLELLEMYKEKKREKG